MTGYVKTPTSDQVAARVAKGWPAHRPFGQAGLEESLDGVLGGRPEIDLQAVSGNGSSRTLAQSRRAPSRRMSSPRFASTPSTTSPMRSVGSYGGAVVLDPKSGAVRGVGRARHGGAAAAGIVVQDGDRCGGAATRRWRRSTPAIRTLDSSSSTAGSSTTSTRSRAAGRSCSPSRSAATRCSRRWPIRSARRDWLRWPTTSGSTTRARFDIRCRRASPRASVSWTPISRWGPPASARAAWARRRCRWHRWPRRSVRRAIYRAPYIVHSPDQIADYQPE